MQKEKIVVMWFKKDLRIADNKALFTACQKGYPVLAVYAREPSMMNSPDYSHFHQYRVQESVKELKRTLSEINIPFVMYHGEVIEMLDKIRSNYEILQLFANEETGNGISYRRDEAIIEYCKQEDITFKEFGTNGVIRKLRSRDERDAKWKNRILSDVLAKPSSQIKRELSKEITDQCKNSFSTFTPAHKPLAWEYQREIPGESNAWIRRTISYNTFEIIHILGVGQT